MPMTGNFIMQFEILALYLPALSHTELLSVQLKFRESPIYEGCTRFYQECNRDTEVYRMNVI